VIRPAAKPIHLDTSFLIRALDPTRPESARLLGWLRDQHSIAISALAWGEFLCGPLAEEDVALASRLVHGHVPVGAIEASEGARLFNHAGRRRNSFPDCIIAGTAITASAQLATSNRADFERFVGAGLELAD